jgi:hypothetical protein
MGLFGRRRRVPPAWHPADSEVLSGIATYDQAQAGESYVVSYVRDDRPDALINVVFYPVAYVVSGGLVVRRWIEMTVLDQHGQQVWSGGGTEDMPDRTLGSLPEAEMIARWYAETTLAEPFSSSWDGVPFDSDVA